MTPSTVIVSIVGDTLIRILCMLSKRLEQITHHRTVLHSQSVLGSLLRVFLSQEAHEGCGSYDAVAIAWQQAI